MGLRTILHTSGHWLKGLVVKVDSEIKFDTTTTPIIDTSTGVGDGFTWSIMTNKALAWKITDLTKVTNVLSINSITDTVTLHPSYKGVGFNTKNITLTPTSPYTATNQNVIMWDCTSGNKVVQLPASSLGFTVTVKKIDSSANTITLTPTGAQTIDGAANLVISTQYKSVTLIGDGLVWFVASSHL